MSENEMSHELPPGAEERTAGDGEWAAAVIMPPFRLRATKLDVVVVLMELDPSRVGPLLLGHGEQVRERGVLERLRFWLCCPVGHGC